MYADKNRLSIKQWAEEDRPREKLLLKGKQSLSDAELIAIILGSGNAEQSAVELARQLLTDVEQDLGLLTRKSIHDLMEYKGIGEAKAVSVAAALELGSRMMQSRVKAQKKITSSRDVYELFSFLSHINREEFWILFLDRKNSILGQQNVSTGGLSATVVDARVIFKQALGQLASSIILIHNHPSGNTAPSEQDKRITRQMTEAGKLLDIQVLDHVIVGQQEFFSFADEGIL